MDIITFQTPDNMRIELSHAVVSSSAADGVKPGDHIFRMVTPSGWTQLALTDEQWGKLVDFLAMTIARKH